MSTKPGSAARTMSIILWLLAAVFLWWTLTVPPVVATAPAILTVAAGVFAFVLWPKQVD